MDMENDPGAGSRVIREPECRRITGLSRPTRWRLERDGRFPRSFRLSANTKGWWLHEVLAWIAERARAAGTGQAA
jgi:prophage regulatory protein